jgi:glycosyltransferase 2 family protein
VSNKNKYLFLLKMAMPVLFLIILGFEAKGMLARLDWNASAELARSLSIPDLIYIFALGIAALSPMYFYDVVLLQLFSIHVPKTRLFFYSLSANAYSNMVGLGGIAGATLRTYFYKKYLPGDSPLIRTAAKLSLFFLTGLSFFSIGVLVQTAGRLDGWEVLPLWAIALYNPLFLAIYWRRQPFWDIPGNRKGFVSELIAISAFEWLFIVLCIWGISHTIGVNISFFQLFPIVVIALCTGIISMVPGGAGSFDLIFLLLVQREGVASEAAILILGLYRLSYYLFPVLLGTPFIVKKMLQK